MIIVISGPGGVGKGTVVERVVARDPRLWLSRSWTTRVRRPGEAQDAYVFVDRPAFERRVADGGFLEHAAFLDNMYGTPVPEIDEHKDIVLEIEVQGAEQVVARQPDALLICVVAPSPEEQERRLRGRGDPSEQVAERVALAAEEVDRAAGLGARMVVNDDLDRTVDEILAIIAAARREAHEGSQG